MATHSSICSVCGTHNHVDVQFCSECIAPLTLEPLSNLSFSDLTESLRSLLELISRVGKRCQASRYNQHEDELLGAYLSAFWLRPETAFLQFSEAIHVYKLLQAADGPILDLGCGNGVHMSLLQGWRFASSFDVFRSVDLSRSDMFDSVSNHDYEVEVQRSGRITDFGIDIRRSAVQQTSELSTFRQVQLADVRNIPITHASLGCIYSNLIRDFSLPLLKQSLAECRRVLRPGGMLILISPTENYQDCLYYRPRAKLAESQGDLEAVVSLERMDRGRSHFCQQQLPLSSWKELMHISGLSLIDSIDFAPKPLIELWDAGLRAFSPALISWSQRFHSNEERDIVKKLVIDLEKQILSPVLDEGSGQYGFRILICKRLV